MNDELEQALARNRQAIVSRVLSHCGYRVDEPDDRPPESTATCGDVEERLLAEGIARRKGLSLRRLWARMTGHDSGNCPSRWTWAAWRRRRQSAKKSY